MRESQEKNVKQEHLFFFLILNNSHWIVCLQLGQLKLLTFKDVVLILIG